MLPLRVMSDLHMNFYPYEVTPSENESDTVLVLAGDVCEVSKKKATYRAFFDNVCSRFRKVVYVFGNHEYYGTSYLRASEQFYRETHHLKNLHVLDMDRLVVDDVAFVGCTLWADMEKRDPLVIMNARAIMSEYSEVRMGPASDPYKRKLTPADTVSDHEAMKRWVFEQVTLARSEGLKPVVVTHHHPTWAGRDFLPSGLINHPLNGCYFSDLSNDILDNGPDLWACGHVHVKVDYTLGSTRVVCNPRGYHTEDGQSEESYCKFDPDFMVEV